MKALVIGADGFVGSYLISELINSGHQVTGTYLNTLPNIKNVTLRKLDILNKSELSKLVGNIFPDVIFNLAAVSSVKYSFENPELTMKINYDGSKNVLGFAKQAKIVLIGSAEEYGVPKTTPIKEDHPLNPKSPYGKSKAAAEEFGRMIAKDGGQVIILRSFNHIGSGQPTDFVVSSFAKQIADIEKENADSIKVGNLDATRDFTDVRDVVSAYVLAAERCEFGVPYNICSGKGYKIKEILNKLCRLSISDIKIEEDPERMRPSDIPIFIGDNTRFKKRTGWNQKVSLDESLKSILEYWRAQ